MRKVSRKRCWKNQNTYFMFHIFFRKSCCLRDVEKYCERTGHICQ